MATKKAAAPKKTAAATTKKKPSAAVTRVVTKEREVVRNTKTYRSELTKEINSSRYMATLIAEFVGTFVLAAAVLATQGQPFIMLFAIAGIVLMFGRVSGAYLNPAFAIAGWLTKRLTAARAVGYILMQVLGALLAYVVMSAVLREVPASSSMLVGQMAGAAETFKVAAVPPAKEWFVILGEVLGTMIFGYAVASATREKTDRTAASLLVGGGLLLGLMIGGFFASTFGGATILNPAVAVAVQAFADAGKNLWPIGVYVFGTTAGAVVGFYLHDLLSRASQEKA